MELPVHLTISYYCASTAQGPFEYCFVIKHTPGCTLAGATGAALPQLSSCGGFLLFPEAIPSIHPAGRNCPAAHCWLRCPTFTRAEPQAGKGAVGRGQSTWLLGLGGRSVPAHVHPEDELWEGW